MSPAPPPRRVKPLVAVAVAFFAASCLIAVASVAWRLTASRRGSEVDGTAAARGDVSASDRSLAPMEQAFRDRTMGSRSLPVLPPSAAAPEPQAAPAPFGAIAPPPPQPRHAAEDDEPRGPDPASEDRARTSGARVPPGVVGTLHTRD